MCHLAAGVLYIPADITKALALLVAESEKRPPQPATGTGLSEALRKVGAEGEGEGEESNPAVPVGDTGDIRDQLDALVERVKGLRKRTAEAALFLMVYDLRRAQEVRGCAFVCFSRHVVYAFCYTCIQWAGKGLDRSGVNIVGLSAQ